MSLKSSYFDFYSLFLFLPLSLFFSAGLVAGQQQGSDEADEDYYKKWLSEDVTFIITEEERPVFQSLSTPNEKEHFIEQFWYRRDPDPRTAFNEFKEEHYRRIAFANERFQSGIAGWKTDRGRIYIIHGPPHEIVSYPSGGRYLRQPHEGGGATSTYPFEVWRYHYLEGMGSEVELEFVDSSWSGEYHLALDPNEKDALIRVPNAGLTLAEELGMARKMERPFFQPGMQGRYPLAYQRVQDSSFARYESLTQAQRAPDIKYKDLQERVKVDISFNSLNFHLRPDYFNLNEQQVLVPITVEVQNKELTFREENGFYVAKIAIYGMVTAITNRLIEEFEEELILSYKVQDVQEALASRSVYQRIITLDKKMRYRLDLVVKDVSSGHIGVVRTAIAPSSYGSQELSASSLILSDMIIPLSRVPARDEMFILGDIKVRPSVSHLFSTENNLGIYLQLYNLGIDQASRTPWMETRYRILRDGQTVIELTGETGEGVRIYSDRRAVLVKTLPVRALEPGEYELEVEIQDRIREESLTLNQNFRLVGAP